MTRETRKHDWQHCTHPDTQHYCEGCEALALPLTFDAERQTEWCDACISVMPQEVLDILGLAYVRGTVFVPAPEVGSWLEANDPNPHGSVGRLHMPMWADGSPDVENYGEIEVAYEEA